MKMKKIKTTAITVLALTSFGFTIAENDSNSYKKVEAYKLSPPKKSTVYKNSNFHEVKKYPQKQFRKSREPKNVVLLIGDGMGISHVMAGLVANKNRLYLENFKNIGFTKTQSADKFVGGSGSCGTAIATGHKTNNLSIGVDADAKPVKNITEIAEENGLATGIVALAAVTHATPASFISHVKSRHFYEQIALDYLKTDVDVVIGGGRDHFEKRSDKKVLTDDLKAKNYQICRSLKEMEKIKSGKLFCLNEPIHNQRLPMRGDMLRTSTRKALQILSKNKRGFFLMVESSEIDHGGHQNDTAFIVDEMLDFDKTIGEVLRFAAKDGKTLVIVASDHETGGMAINNGNMETGEVNAKYTTGGHTGLMTPVFAIGPGSENFRGIYENTELFHKMVNALKLKVTK